MLGYNGNSPFHSFSTSSTLMGNIEENQLSSKKEVEISPSKNSLNESQKIKPQN
jgi:hypothetical protein